MFIFFDVIKKEAFRVCQSFSTVINVLGFKNYNQVMIGNLRRWLQLVLPLCQDLLLSISIHILGVSVKLIFIFECLQRVSWCMSVDMAKNGGDVAISIFTKQACIPSFSCWHASSPISLLPLPSSYLHRPGHVNLIWHAKSPPPLTFVFGARQNLVGAWDQWCHSTLLGSPSTGARLRSR